MDLTYFILFATCLYELVEPYKFSETWRKDTTNNKLTSQSFLLDTMSFSSRIMCSGACKRNPRCDSFFFNSLTKTCQLHNFVFPKHGAFIDATPSVGNEYFRRVSSFVKCHGTSVTGLQNEYFIPPATENKWTEALKICQRYGGELASLPDLSTIEHLKTLINDSLKDSLMSSALWVNAIVSKQLNSFVWYNNRDIIGLNSDLWYKNQPDLFNNPGSMTEANKTECVILVPFFGYLLDDYACENGNLGAMLHPLCVCA